MTDPLRSSSALLIAFLDKQIHELEETAGSTIAQKIPALAPRCDVEIHGYRQIQDELRDTDRLRAEVECLTRALGTLQIKCDKFQEEAAVAIDNQDDLREHYVALREELTVCTRERDEARAALLSAKGDA